MAPFTALMLLCWTSFRFADCAAVITFYSDTACGTVYGTWTSNATKIHIANCSCVQGTAMRTSTSQSGDSWIKLMCTAANGYIITSYNDAACSSVAGTSQMHGGADETQEQQATKFRAGNCARITDSSQTAELIVAGTYIKPTDVSKFTLPTCSGTATCMGGLLSSSRHSFTVPSLLQALIAISLLLQRAL